MRSFFVLLLILSAHSYAAIEIKAASKLSCVRDANGAKEKSFSIFDKFSISELKGSKERVLTTNELEMQGTCHMNQESELVCDYSSKDGIEYHLKIDALRSQNPVEYQGVITKKSFLDKTSKISCLTY